MSRRHRRKRPDPDEPPVVIDDQDAIEDAIAGYEVEVVMLFLRAELALRRSDRGPGSTIVESFLEKLLTRDPGEVASNIEAARAAEDAMGLSPARMRGAPTTEAAKDELAAGTARATLAGMVALSQEHITRNPNVSEQEKRSREGVVEFTRAFLAAPDRVLLGMVHRGIVALTGTPPEQ